MKDLEFVQKYNINIGFLHEDWILCFFGEFDTNKNCNELLSYQFQLLLPHIIKIKYFL